MQETRAWTPVKLRGDVRAQRQHALVQGGKMATAPRSQRQKTTGRVVGCTTTNSNAAGGIAGVRKSNQPSSSGRLASNPPALLW
mmetsp:Transcript_134715/g.336167  ORF Transcript_134715/g.336167 Transcript_134715/m.336167 type:complete len:84 (-) Transcript_134715:209-460(-)